MQENLVPPGLVADNSFFMVRQCWGGCWRETNAPKHPSLHKRQSLLGSSAYFLCKKALLAAHGMLKKTGRQRHNPFPPKPLRQLSYSLEVILLKGCAGEEADVFDDHQLYSVINFLASIYLKAAYETRQTLFYWIITDWSNWIRG
jgi:hypothetical protein